MKNEILFSESQPFWRNKLLLITIIFVNIVFIWGFVQQVLFDITWGNNPMSNLMLSITLGLIILFSCLLLIRQQTIITEEGIYVRYFPFDFRTRFFAWDNIQEAYIRKYNPMLEYGGWGKRFGIKGAVYNISGNMGLQLVLKNRKELSRKVLIGTNNTEELEEVLKNLNDKRKQK